MAGVGGKATIYTEAQNAFIRDLWMAGRSAAQIRDLFIPQFGRHVTRNAMIARIHRMGLTGARGDPNVTRAIGASQMQKDRKAVEQRTRPVKPVVKPAPLTRIVAFGPVHDGVGNGPKPMDVEAVSDDGVGIDLLDLKPGQCRWPMKGGGFCAHGCERERGRFASFCPAHKARASDGKPPVRDYGWNGDGRKTRTVSAAVIGKRYNGF